MRETKKNNLKKNESEVCVNTAVETMINNLKFSDDFEHIIAASRKNLCLRNHKLYDNTMKSFWINEYLFGRKSYKWHQQLFQGPTIKTIKNWIKMEKEISFQEFLHLENLEKIIYFWKNIYDFGSINATLSIDALKVDEDLVIKWDGTVIGTIQEIHLDEPDRFRKDFILYKNLWKENLENGNIVAGMFVFLLCPHNKIHGFPIHVYTSKSGSADNNIDKKITQIIEVLKDLDIFIKVVSTDSDTHYRKFFNEQFDWILKYFINNKIINSDNTPTIIYSNDIAHILKRARSRLVKKRILFVNRSDSKLFDKNNLNVKKVSINDLMR